MTSICMNGQSSVIQKTALLGSEANRKVTVYGKRNAISVEGLGLLDLLKLRFPLEQGKSASILQGAIGHEKVSEGRKFEISPRAAYNFL